MEREGSSSVDLPKYSLGTQPSYGSGLKRNIVILWMVGADNENPSIMAAYTAIFARY
jgi:hypothetical protein